MAWQMEILIDAQWVPIGQKDKDPYRYETREEAARMLNICYPDQCREVRLGANPEVRVKVVTDKWNTSYK